MNQSDPSGGAGKECWARSRDGGRIADRRLSRAAPPLGKPRPASIPPRAVVLAETAVAGYQFHLGGVSGLEERLAPGDSLYLVREPKNPHDPRAIAVHAREGEKLGYVPRALNPVLAALADAGVLLQGIVIDMDRSAPPWKRVRIAIYCLLPAPVFHSGN